MKTIIWDADGTLIDSEASIIASYEYAVEKLGITVPENVNFKTFIGYKPQEACRMFLNLTDEKAQEMTNVFRARYQEKEMFTSTLYDGIVEVLEEFKKRGYKQAMATNKRHDLAIEVCKHFDITKYFDVIWGADKEGKYEKGDLISFCLKDLGVSDKSTALMIGDTHIDQGGAKECEIPFLAVHYGIGNVEMDYTVAHPLDILKFVAE